jgi:hypothetical protein
MIKGLINNSLQTDNIVIIDLVSEMREKEPDADFSFSHKGEPVTTILLIIPVNNIECNFVYILTSDNTFLYYFPCTKELCTELVLSDLGYDENAKEVVGIDFEDKHFCIEIIDKESFLYINFITTTPDKCDSVMCNRLAGLFSMLYCFLSSIGYDGIVWLKDDVVINGEFITYKRLLEGKGSIYTKYGFRILPNVQEKIDELLKFGKLEELKVLSRNIPMVSQNIIGFNSC